MHELKTEALTKEYKGKKAVSEVTLSLTSGVYGLLGENGAGKTTLMRMLCGLLKQDKGRILCDGTEIQKMGGGYRRLLGYLPQNFGYYPDYSAKRFLMYMAALKGLPQGYSRRRVDELLELVSLTEEKDKKLKTFSGGMLKRVGIAQALLNEPEILILDEPTSGLDPNERVRFRNIISSLSKERIVILSTHIVSDIEYIADEIFMMKKGGLVTSGTVQQLNREIGNFVWEYIADGEEAEQLKGNYVIANLKNQREGILLRIISRDKPVPGAVNVEPTLEDTYLYYLNADKYCG